MNTTTTAPPSDDRQPQKRPGRLMIDAPVRVFHGLFALSFAGAWLTAESERWRDVHMALGYAFGGLLVLRLVYGLLGPRQARLGSLVQRVAGLGDWMRRARAGQLDLPRVASLGLAASVLLMLALAAPLVLAGHASDTGWLGLDDALEEVHEFLAQAELALVLAHLGLIACLSALRGRNLARPMLTGRAEGTGPDLVKANRAWLGGLVLLAYLGFVGWQLSQPAADPTAAPPVASRGTAPDNDDD